MLGHGRVLVHLDGGFLGAVPNSTSADTAGDGGVKIGVKSPPLLTQSLPITTIDGSLKGAIV